MECEGNRILVAIYMANYVGAAIEDHPEVAPAEYYQRFMGWIRERPH